MPATAMLQNRQRKGNRLFSTTYRVTIIEFCRLELILKPHDSEIWIGIVAILFPILKSATV